MIFISPGKSIDLSYNGGGGGRIIKELYIVDSGRILMPLEGCIEQPSPPSNKSSNKIILFLLKVFNDFFLLKTLYTNYMYAYEKNAKHGFSTILTDDICYAYAFKKVGWRVILTYHGVGNPLAEKYDFNSIGFFSIYPLSYLLYKRIYTFCDLIIFPSEGGMIKYLSSFNTFNITKILAKTIFITNGIPDPLKQVHLKSNIEEPVIKTISGKVIKSHEKSILCVARMISDKGIDVLLEAFSHFLSKNDINKGTNLIIVGTGPEEKKLKKLIVDLGLEDSISLIKKLSKEQIYFYIKNTKLFAVTPRQTVCDLIFLEVMALGKNILTTSIPGNVYMFKGTDVILKQLDPEAISDGLLKGISSKQDFSEKNRNVFLNFHSVDKMYNQYIESITAICE